MCSIVCIIQDITSSLFDLKPPFWGHHSHYIRHRVHCICDITPTLSMISQPLCVWYHIQYMWDILSTIFMTSYPLCMRSQPCVLITPHSAYVWHHLRYWSHHIHSITPSHNLYDFTSTSGMTDITTPVSDITPTVSLSSQPLHWYHTHFCMTSHPLYLWYHTHYI